TGRDRDVLYGEQFARLSRVHPQIEEALNGVQRQHGKELAACEALRDLVIDLLDPWTGGVLDPQRMDVMLAALLSRSVKTFWAVIELARVGFGEQAVMLNR